MTLRRAQALLLGASGFYLLLVVFNNLTDYGSNLLFVQHVLSMDTTFPGNHGLWRAVSSPTVHTLFYFTIIAWEMLACALQSAAALRLWRAVTPEARKQARALGTLGLTISMLQWWVAFLAVGGEWFLMWQSRIWNGQEAAFRMFTMMGVCLIVLHLGGRQEEGA
ncbi:MAG TPA: DUF2165 domain-containing protein [Opitutaceae bacterium]|jgi:predicted small integral membrane protein